MAGRNPRVSNGHRRREAVARVKAEETHCALCGQPIDQTLTTMPGQHGPRCSHGDCPGCVPHPARPEVDEDIPVSRGGSPYARANLTLMHRACNAWKGAMTLAEARTKLATTARPGREPATVTILRTR